MSHLKLIQQYREPKIFNNKYIIKTQISSGSFGVVYLAYDKYTKEECAVKLEKEEAQDDVCTIVREVLVLKRLIDIDGTPQMLWHGVEQDYNVLVLELLGKDLAHYLKTHKRFSLKTVLEITSQLVAILQRVHQRGVVHRDLKPENILVGIDTSKIYLVDYGVSKIYMSLKGHHIPFRDKKQFIGTTRYAAIAAHQGFEIGRKDDLESLLYVMIYFLRAYLKYPRQQTPLAEPPITSDKDRTEVVGNLKISTPLEDLCKVCPPEFVTILRYVKSLKFESEPNYEYIQDLIRQAAANNNIILDRTMDWTERGTHQYTSSNDNVKSDQMKFELPNGLMVNESLLRPPLQRKSSAQGSPSGRLASHSPSNCSFQGSLASMQMKYTPSKDSYERGPGPLCVQKQTSQRPSSFKSRGLSPNYKIGFIDTINGDDYDDQVQQSQEMNESPKHSPKKKNEYLLIFLKQVTNETEAIRTKDLDEYEENSPRLLDKYQTHQVSSVYAASLAKAKSSNVLS